MCHRTKGRPSDSHAGDSVQKARVCDALHVFLLLLFSLGFRKTDEDLALLSGTRRRRWHFVSTDRIAGGQRG